MFDRVFNDLPRIDGRAFRHREVCYDPGKLRERRKFVYILTDIPVAFIGAFIEQTDGVVESLSEFSDAHIAESAFYVYFDRAETAVPYLRRIKDCGGLFAPPPMFDKVPFQAVSARALDSYNEAGSILGHEPFMGLEVHMQLCQAVELTRHLQGDFVEIGVFSGSSALTALTHMRRLGIRRRCWLLDTYAGFNYKAAEESADVIWSGTHLMDPGRTMARIESLMSRTGQEIHVVPNEVCSDHLPDEIRAVALANIDVDMYDAVASALNKVAPLVIHRGIIVVEDPASTPGLYGAYLALNEFLESDLGGKFVGVRTTTQYFLIRTHP